VKKLYVIILLMPVLASAYELGMFHLEVPTPLEQFSLEFDMEHRFYGGIIDSLSQRSLLGLYSTGANSLLGLKFTPLKGLEIGVARKSVGKEGTVGISYSLRVPAAFIRGRVGVEFFSCEESGGDERAKNFFYQVGLQSKPILKRIKPTVTVAYDGYNQRLGLGTGLSILLFKYVWYFEEISLLGEYYPVFGRSDELYWLGERDAFIAGVGFSTSGHQFLLSVGNTWDTSARRLMLGTDSEGLHVGIGIKRVFKF
jgi:hypothetical protein